MLSSERRDDVVVVRAPAKVNLFLEILARRPDGYHELATLMVAVSLYDTLEFREAPAGTFGLTCDVPELSTGPENLVCKAAALLSRTTGCAYGAEVTLRKRIPMAAGLAGGSTDAAATLFGLNRLWHLGLTEAELRALAADLGSDVPFFLGPAAAWCTGRGEIITPVPSARPLDLLLVCPEFGLSTAAVYRRTRVPAQPRDGTALRQALADGDLEALGAALHNRLEEPAFELQPELCHLLKDLQALRPLGARMSGSGSALFALCRDACEAERLTHTLRGATETEKPPGGWTSGGLRLHLVRSCS